MIVIKKLFILTFLLTTVTAVAQLGFGDAQLINKDWKFSLSDQKDFSEPHYDDSKWKNVQLPHDWSVRQPLSPSLASATAYLPGGIGWYRKHFTPSESLEDQKVYIYFEGVYNRSEVYLNGHLLGKRPNGYISFAYDATPYIKYGEENIISVRVDHSQYADSRWYPGSGIYRDVWLVNANPIHIDQWGVFAHPVVKGNRGELHIETVLKNETQQSTDLKVVHELFDHKGVSVGNTSETTTVTGGDSIKLSTEIKVRGPKLWSLDHPNLYSLKTTVYSGDKIIDQSTVTTGFRTFSFDPDKGFSLNGESMKMKGVCLHHDAGVLGAAVPKSVWRSRLATLKSMGVNAVRTSHNPQSPDFYEVCDEIGLLVLNEAYDEWVYPKRKWIDGWNVGEPGFQGSYDIFKNWAEEDLADMVRRDRNHISVFAWSIGNEVDYPNDPYSHPVLDGGKDTGFKQPIFGGYNPEAPDAEQLGDIAKRLVKVVKEFDTSRPVTAGLAGVAMSNETEYPGALDIAGYNYTESKYISDHKQYPDRIIYGSENGHGYDAWKAVTENEFIFGQFLWTGFDYLGESGSWPSRGLNTGLVNFAGIIKPRGHFRQALWKEEPFIYAGTYINRNNDRLSIDAWPFWNYKNGDKIRVVCYTNTTHARLELNGKIIGQEKPFDTKTGIIYWDVPYSAGKLEVVGLNNGEEAIRYAIETSKRPKALKVVQHDNKIQVGDVTQVLIQIVDQNNVPVMLSDNEISCEINGSATLLGLESGSNTDMSDYTDHKQRAYHGKLLAYIKAEKAGKLEIRFTAPWLDSDTITIQVEP